MNDDQLRDELQRRASRVAAPELLPGISSRLDAREGGPAHVGRWAPLAGLAAAAVIVVAIVIAFPGGIPLVGSRQSPGPALDVMTTDVFASALQRGALTDETVLVNGSIVAYDGPAIFGGYCGPYGPGCVLGQIEGAQPRVVVFGPDIAVPSASDASVTYAGSDVLTLESAGSSPAPNTGWPWWKRLAPPIRGTLVLSVDPTDTVAYDGKVVPNGDQLTWSAGEVMNRLDVNARDLDEVILINGWLTGLDVAASCALGPPAISGLPQTTECGRVSWLADERAVIDPNLQAVPPSAIQVQPKAFLTYAPDASARSGNSLQPQRALYAVSRRLYGEGCIDPTAPCWNWSIVGRLSQPAPDVVPASLSPVTTPELAPTPTAVATESGRELTCGNDMVVMDPTRAIDSCESALGFDSNIGIATYGAKIMAQWIGAMCTPDVRASLASSVGGLILSITESSPPYPSAAPSCAGGPITRTLTLMLRSPIQGDVQAMVDGQDLPVLPSPSPSLTGTAPQPSTMPASSAPVIGSDSTSDFTLTITAPKSVYTTNEAIEIQATLSYVGGQQSMTLSGSGSGLVTFGIKQLDGTLEMEGVSTADCKLGGYTVLRDGAMIVPFIKGGAFDRNGPDAPFWQVYLADPLLYLPLGHWQVYAYSAFSEGTTCFAEPMQLRASLEIEVTSE